MLITAAAVVALVAGMPSATAQSTCEDLGGTVGADQVCHVQSTTTAYAIDISFPLGYPDQQAVADYLEQDRVDFLNWVTRFGGDHHQYVHNVNAKTYHSPGTRSLVLTVVDDTGLAHEDHPGTTYQAFNYDEDEQAPITIDTLFKPGTDPLRLLNSIVQRELGTHSDVPVRNDLDVNTYRNFAITDDAVTFFFGEDEVVADNNGPHRIAVPRSELASMLA
ncbi:hypothetical protein A5724_28350 [Mycobacterium sp. ACS1612]|uniref:esterase n=1 Tax=Mycobacterium sp. ACS1612 TaxID=1834117 RepID=UPI0007FF8282|nr:esterase [Mycobacterium sp. ACS1612]OBF28466.1 hypothetical protein A5724_28350 [Mycobacterium sp. ACS1612]